MITTFLQYLSIFLLSTCEIWVAVPLGVAYKINPLTVILLSTIGAVTGMIIIMYVGGKIMDFILKKIKTKHEKKDSKLMQIWQKFGVIGLGIIGPVIVGSPVIAVLGVILKVDKKRLILFSTIGIMIKAILLAATAYYGIAFLKTI